MLIPPASDLIKVSLAAVSIFKIGLVDDSCCSDGLRTVMYFTSYDLGLGLEFRVRVCLQLVVALALGLVNS